MTNIPDTSKQPVSLETPAEKEALNKVKLNSFTVVPATVSPYGTVTATWDVTIPTTEFEIRLSLHDQEVGPSGTKTFTLGTQRDSFALIAFINDPPLPFARRILKAVEVTVNTSGCLDQGFEASKVTDKVKEAMDGAFSGGGNFTLKPGGSIVTAGSNGLVDIHVPLEIVVPDWFDADMDIHIALTISGADGHVIVAAPVVDPQVHWDLLSNLASLGCTDAIGLGMTKISYAFLERIVDNEVRPTVEQNIEEVVNQVLGLFQLSDPQHRTYAMTTLVFSAERGLIISGCPR